tara:strand:+ start:2131 stop:2775 length:645 start_codon:yes stop_codon:yes gene_type:complete
MHYLGFDLETGGFDKKNDTINEAYFAIWDENWNLLEDLHLLLKNNDGEIHGTQEAYDITGINPEEHLANPETITYAEGKIKILAMLGRHKIYKKRNHFRFLGANIVYFDIPFMNEQDLLTEEEYKKAGVHHNSLDTTLIVTWLKEIGILPSNVGSVSSLIEYFGLVKGKAHTAKADVEMTKEIYIRLCDLLKKSTVANLGAAQADNDLLKIVEL